jgi:hypothetical protein
LAEAREAREPLRHVGLDVVIQQDEWRLTRFRYLSTCHSGAS